jgi:hypothetical protein
MYTVYELSIFLDDIAPLIWRRFLIPAHATLDDLHQVIQVVMGWDDLQGHCFTTGGMRFAQPRRNHGRCGQVIGNEATCRIGDVLVKPKQRMIYVYDSTGAPRSWPDARADRASGVATAPRDWRHTITLVAMQASLSAIPRCMDGGRACPPESFGGPEGYARFLSLPADPATGRRLAGRSGHGIPADFDPDSFHSHAVNRRLARAWTPGRTRASEHDATPSPVPGMGTATVAYLRHLIPGH